MCTGWQWVEGQERSDAVDSRDQRPPEVLVGGMFISVSYRQQDPDQCSS